jgi:hypothetical protein
MKRQNKKILLSFWLLASFVWQTIPVSAQQAIQPDAFYKISDNQDGHQILNNLLRHGRGAEFSALLEKIFGGEADEADSALGEDSAELFLNVSETAAQKAEERLEEQITERREKPAAKPIVAPGAKTNPVRKTIKKTTPKSKKLGFYDPPALNWRQLAFGFQPLGQDEKPVVKMTETDKEIKAEGSDKKSFETKDAKGTRTQKAETRYLKDGKTFGVEIKNTEIIEAVSKADGKSFRKEISLLWGAEVAACPDVNGVSAGTGKAKVLSKTIYTENGETVTMTSEFDLQAKLTGYVNDQAEMKHYDLELDAYTTNSGYEDALKRNLIKEIKLKDGRYGLHFDIAGNTIEVSDGQYGGYRKPAKMGKAGGRALTPMSDADAKLVSSAIGSMVPTIWNSANEMYKSAERNWKNYGCVEVLCRVPKTTLKAGEEIAISTETVHLTEGSKINAELKAESYQAQISPESQSGTPGATFAFTQEDGEENSSFHVESVSKRGIGRGDVEFQTEKEDEAVNGAWTGTITAERRRREEREKRAGANLAENGGYLETLTNVKLQLTGKLDRSVEATNAHVALVTGRQEQIDFEYDKYKIDEGYCGPNAVPYKGPKEITRTSRTTADYNKETRVYVEIGGSGGGTITFSLPETAGRTVHSYVHKSPCAEHDRANTSEAVNEDTPTVGGSFSFSFPVDGTQKSVKGSLTVREEDGAETVYTWELTRL